MFGYFIIISAVGSITQLCEAKLFSLYMRMSAYFSVCEYVYIFLYMLDVAELFLTIVRVHLSFYEVCRRECIL